MCPHFGVCGGCQMQDVPYPDQLARKADELGALFAPFWEGPVPVEPSPAVWYYRNKVDPAFGRKFYDEPPPAGFERESMLGFKRKGRWYWPINIEDCRIGPEGLGDLLSAVRAWMGDQGLRAFDSRSKDGFLRSLLVRDGKRTGERMVVLITRPGTFDRASFVETVQAAYPATSIYRGIFHGLADLAFSEEMELLDGAPTIDEHLHVPDGPGVRKLRFRLSPFSFFQTNTLATERLYGAVRQWVKTVAPRTLVDLYCGAGGIGFTAADLVERVWAVESVYSATEDGAYNATANGIDNVTFVAEKVKNYLLGALGEGGLPPDTAVVADPSRAGMHPKALRRLIDLAPPAILYVSCNPKILARELEAFTAAYRLEDLRGVDLFPHTRHVEVLARLARQSH